MHPFNDFLADLKEMLYTRTKRIHLSQESKTYSNLKADADWFFKHLNMVLPEDGESRAQLLKLANTYNGMECEAVDYFYQKGVSEGIKLVIQGLIGV